MINWDDVYNLSPHEFSEDPDKYADPQLIYNLGVIRKFTQRKIRPSPVEGALARFNGSEKSQHYVGPKDSPIRKSTASDIFCEGIPIATYTSILASGLFNGIGIYLDTIGPDGTPWVMFHVDIRKEGFNRNSPLIWIAKKVQNVRTHKRVTKYRYPQADNKYWSLLNDRKMFRDKKFGN